MSVQIAFRDYDGARDAYQKIRSGKIGNNTYVWQVEDGGYAVRVHNTDVVIFYADGRIKLNSGGWYTDFTQTRINEFLPYPWYLNTKRGQFYLYDALSDQNYRFTDGITIDTKTRQVTGQRPDESQEEHNAAVEKLLKQYLDTLTMKDVTLALASQNKSCTPCHEGHAVNQRDLSNHLREHLVRHELNKSLLWQAFAEAGYPNVAAIIQHYARCEDLRVFKKNLRKYFRRHLLIGAKVR